MTILLPSPDLCGERRRVGGRKDEERRGGRGVTEEKKGGRGVTEERRCGRCNRSYLSPGGQVGEQCTYHWGKLRSRGKVGD